MEEMAYPGFGAAFSGESFHDAAVRSFPLSREQEIRCEQVLVAFSRMTDLNGLKILAERPDESVLRQLVNHLYHEDGSPKTIEETSGF